ncbi:hypothetical protein Cgig2_018943 [Carnegiea gigantea]|uniref:Uncharacterized protein n=1 Tax=Carnegiea gigantea TaxID=171969 RepID=A0A9Q1GTX5_9CARY|nr:hypothetical protein Cgig2_018943 [Carnegiea gigantea]
MKGKKNETWDETAPGFIPRFLPHVSSTGDDTCYTPVLLLTRGETTVDALSITPCPVVALPRQSNMPKSLRNKRSYCCKPTGENKQDLQSADKSEEVLYLSSPPTTGIATPGLAGLLKSGWYLIVVNSILFLSNRHHIHRDLSNLFENHNHTVPVLCLFYLEVLG